MNAVDYITAKQAADILQIQYRLMLAKVSGGGGLNAEKIKGRWQINKATFDRFHDSNTRAIKKLEKEYISLYRQGLTVKLLKERTREDFEKRGILYGDIDGFAEWTIYKHIMGEQGKSKIAGEQYASYKNSG